MNPGQSDTRSIALYIRVSTEEQAQRGFSIEAQKERLAAYCDLHGWPAGSYYVDDGYSGTHLDRPGLTRLLQDVRSGRVGTVAVYRLDRLSRRQKDVLHLLEDVFERHNCHFKSATEPFDTSTPLGRAMLGILAVFAQLERDTIVERVTSGIRERRRQGLWHGGRAPFGYRPGPGGTLIQHPREASWVAAVYDAFLDGQSLSEIARRLNGLAAGRRFDHKSVRELLDRPVYAGKQRDGEGFLDVRVDRPAIPFEKWLAAQRRLSSANRPPVRKKSSRSSFLLSGLLNCAVCGAPMHGRTVRSGGREYRYYACRNQNSPGRSGRVPRCRVGLKPADAIEQSVEEAVRSARLRTGPEKTDQTGRGTPDWAPALMMELRELGGRRERWLAAYEDGTIDRELLGRQMSALDRREAALSTALSTALDAGSTSAECAQNGASPLAGPVQKEGFPPTLKEESRPTLKEESRPTLAERRQVLRHAIDSVQVDGQGNLHIVWRSNP